MSFIESHALVATALLAEAGPDPTMIIVTVVGSIILFGIIGRVIAKPILGKFNNSQVLTSGVPARAQITSLEQTGTQVNDQPYVIFGLSVHRDGMAPYDTHVKQVLPLIMLGTVTPGKWVHVKVSPADPQKIAIDFSAPVTDAETA